MLILGIGNELRSDDALGSILSQRLSIIFKDKENVTIIDGGSVPENYTGIIKKENPSHILILDAVEMRQKPGSLRLVDKEEIANYELSTHAMPLSFLIKYLESQHNYKIILLGIQPKSIAFGSNISQEIQESMDKVIHILLDLCRD